MRHSSLNHRSTFHFDFLFSGGTSRGLASCISPYAPELFYFVISVSTPPHTSTFASWDSPDPLSYSSSSCSIKAPYQCNRGHWTACMSNSPLRWSTYQHLAIFLNRLFIRRFYDTWPECAHNSSSLITQLVGVVAPCQYTHRKSPCRNVSNFSYRRHDNAMQFESTENTRSSGSLGSPF